MKIIIGSTSQRKIDIVHSVFKEFYRQENIEVEGISVDSGVSNTPYDEQTPTGAINRAKEAKEMNDEADWYVGLETGLTKRYGLGVFDESWAVVMEGKSVPRSFVAYSSALPVPNYVLVRMAENKREHSDEMTFIEKECNLPNDNWNTYSRSLKRETSLYEALRNAIAQSIKNDGNLYHE